MASWDNPSGWLYGIAYPSLERQRSRTDSHVRVLATEEKERPPVPQRMEAGDIFQDVFLSGGKSRPRSLWAAIGSLSFQLFLVLAMVVIPLFHIDPLPKWDTPTMLYLPPPPTALAKAAALQAPPKLNSTYTPARIVPTVHKTEEAPPPTVATSGGVVGGVPGGMAGGVPAGVLGGILGVSRSIPLPPQTPEPAPVKRIRVASGVAEANLIHDVPPQYPPDAGRERIEGTVVLLAVIGTDGSVQDVQVMSGLPILAQAAVEAVKQWRYKPYLLNGVPVEIDSRITINFTLARG